MESDEEKYETVVTYTTLAREAEPTQEPLYRRQERERDQRTRSDLQRSGLLGPYEPYQLFATSPRKPTGRTPSPDPGVEFCNTYLVGGDWRDPEDRQSEEDRVPPPDVNPPQRFTD